MFQISASELNLKAGESQVVKSQLHIGCSDSTIRLIEIQLEGKKRGSDIDLFNGYRGNNLINQ